MNGGTSMLLQTYDLSELKFAFCHHVYVRWRTHLRRSQPKLVVLTADLLDNLLHPYDIRALEATCNPTNTLLLLSLKPGESVSSAVSKTKGRMSKWLRKQLLLDQPIDLFGKGYFACTSGKSTREAVQTYLEVQGEHHGYSDRARPPIFVRQRDLAGEDDARLQTAHAVTLLQYHLVFATFRRRGVFSQSAARAVADYWEGMESEHRFALRKVSFVPDHVHVALRTHPAQSPAGLAVLLMNAAQELMWREFSNNILRAGVERLWQASAYIGSYGELASPQIRQYIRNWEAARLEEVQQPKEPRDKPVGSKSSKRDVL
jgi:putative transposase